MYHPYPRVWTPLTDHNNRDVRLMVFDCNCLFFTDYSFNGDGWQRRYDFYLSFFFFKFELKVLMLLICFLDIRN